MSCWLVGCNTCSTGWKEVSQSSLSGGGSSGGSPGPTYEVAKCSTSGKQIGLFHLCSDIIEGHPEGPSSRAKSGHISMWRELYRIWRRIIPIIEILLCFDIYHTSTLLIGIQFPLFIKRFFWITCIFTNFYITFVLKFNLNMQQLQMQKHGLIYIWR